MARATHCLRWKIAEKEKPFCTFFVFSQFYGKNGKSEKNRIFHQNENFIRGNENNFEKILKMITKTFKLSQTRNKMYTIHRNHEIHSNRFPIIHSTKRQISSE